jgi:hypothetical protein
MADARLSRVGVASLIVRFVVDNVPVLALLECPRERI